MVASVRKKSERGVGSDNHQDQPPGIWDSREGVEQAMKELSEMEHKLQNAVRKQRLAVESSDLSVEEKPEDAALRLEPYVPAKRSINQTFDYDPDGMGQAPLDGYEADVAMGDIEEAKVDENESNTIDRGARRPPAINSDQLPLPWTGRLGYACLNTYLRTANPPVFSSRTCRISSIIDHRHPLKDPSQPGHPTKNRPDKKQLPSHERGQEYVQELGLANARDIVKMLRWNNKYGIKFMRLSSEMFPFASHAEYGYKLAPFASEVLAEAGKVAAELGHRLTTHPGQFTQIGSPRNEVVISALRDLEYHDELLSLLKLPEEMDRDAVMILHMGGTYGDKAATLDRFRKNYAKLSDSVKRRLVLENDDVAWSVHDLLPVCEELNIPLVLDFHHHNIIFDPSLREGTLDIMQLFDRIKKTWTRKGIRQKMHYSEPTAAAVTPRDRRKHSPRVKTLPPCAKDMDLMIEAKDKEQAVFELMRTFKLPGWDLFNNIIPFERDDESRKAVKKKKAKKGRKNGKKTGEVDRKLDGARNSDKDEDGNKEGTIEGGEDDDIEIPERIVNDEDFGMGGPENRVYWPEGMDEWLRPKKREVKTGKTKDEE
ncbi:Fc.00g046960.m01.CDS01 [Cosmosporella sp. VM-42]